MGFHFASETVLVVVIGEAKTRFAESTPETDTSFEGSEFDLQSGSFRPDSPGRDGLVSHSGSQTPRREACFLTAARALMVFCALSRLIDSLASAPSADGVGLMLSALSFLWMELLISLI